MVQSYKKNHQVATNYDAIVIGSGMGSLTTAALLAKEGQKVLVLERHYTAGGFTHVFKRKGYEWDVGIHYIGDVQRPMSPIKKLFDYVSKWSGTRWMKRGDDYKALKEKFSQRLFEHLFKQVPRLRDKIDYYELSTPLTTQHFVNYQNGEIYGIEHTPDRFRQKFLKPGIPILTGQDIVTAGVGAALFAGLITASAITKINFMKKIYK